MMHSNSFAYGLQFHFLFGLLLLVGAVLFVVWMAKFAGKEQLKNWIIGLLVVGLLGGLISFAILSNVAYRRNFFMNSQPGIMMDDNTDSFTRGEINFQ